MGFLKNYLLGLSLLIFFSCKTTKNIVDAPVKIQEEFLDTLVISAPAIDTSINEEETASYSLPVYHPSYLRKNDLIHTKLDLSFDWNKQYVFGKAELSIKPLFYPIDQVILDAKNFDIHKVSLFSKEVDYQYDGTKLNITLDRAYAADEVYVLFIEYTAKPNEGPQGGSQAITSDKGLFFINPLGDDPSKPQQIWTQGETENNSRWFPTIDKPIERCSQEISLTVENRFVTLSNGLMISSQRNADNTRTDTWRQDKPHAPYLFMLAVGEFAVVKEQWNNISVDYYVEPEYADYAKKIFNHTPEMLQFFSDKLNMEYPWDKYAQVAVRDYVSGAMENTSAVIFGEFVQKTEEELVDNHNDFIVAHEMIHHWFGDLVTCESWANLTMNEGFANYGEYLWFEHKYGKDEADFHRQNELFGYLNQVQSGNIHPLIHFGYTDKEEMFDGHSYNKGGLVLHMLRKYMGDEAFYAGLKKYLTDNAFSAVEAHHLRLAMESIIGEDLNWFFNQWFFNQGHPILSYETAFDEDNKELTLIIFQEQDPEYNPAIFILPMEVAVYYEDGSYESFSIKIDEREQIFKFNLKNDFANVILDHHDELLCIINEDKSDLAYKNQYLFAPNYIHRLKALQYFISNESPLEEAVIGKAIEDSHWSIRAGALSSLAISDDSRNKIITLATADLNSNVRASAIQLLASDAEHDHENIITTAITQEKALVVKSEALKALSQIKPEVALKMANEMSGEVKGPMLDAVAEILASSADRDYIPFFEEKIHETNDFNVMGLMNHYTHLLQAQNIEVISEKTTKLKDLATDMEISMFKRYASAKAINDLKINLSDRRLDNRLSEGDRKTVNEEYQKLIEYLVVIKSTESNPQLKNAYMFFN